VRRVHLDGCSYHHRPAPLETANDEDITSSDMIILVTFDSKVKQFFIMSICNTFDELMMHHDVCSISFSRKVLNAYGRHGGPNMFDRGPNPTPPHISPQDHHVTFRPRKERIKSNTFWKVGFGLQKSTNMRRSPRPHVDSVWGI
jgi:hypothetical protein